MKKKIIIISIIFITLIITIIFNIMIGKEKIKITKLEEETIKKRSEIVTSVLECYDSDEAEINKYITYAVEFNYQFNDDNDMSPKEIKEFIEKIFNKKISIEDLESYGLNPVIHNESIYFDIDKKAYVKVANKNQKEISTTKINKYIIKKIEKKDEETYIVTYSKYVIDNPYEVYNYFQNQNDIINQNEEINKENELYDTEPLKKYLLGESKLIDFKKYITDNNVEKFGKKDKEIKITYKLINENLLIDNIQ